MRPTTAARWRSIFSFRGSRSMRAAMIACSVSGIRFAAPRPRAASAPSPRRRAGCPRTSRAASAGRPPTARGRRAARRRAPRSRRRRAARARSTWRGRGHRPSPGVRSSSSGRARQTIRSGASRTRSARCSSSSSSGSSAQWMSSKTRTSGCASASSAAHSRAAQAISCWLRSVSTASSTPAARPRRSATASSPQQARSFSTASCTGSSSVMPAATLTISASGQYVIPSPYGSERPVRIVARLDPRHELAREAALADPGLAVDREQVRAPVAHDAREGGVEQLELVLAADERHRDRRDAAVRVADADDTAHRHRVAEAAQVERAAVLVVDDRGRSAGRRTGR